MIHLGLKGNVSEEQVEDRMKYTPTTYEFHLVYEDLLNIGYLEERIEYVYSKGVENIVLHHPMRTSEGYMCETYISKERSPKRYKEWEESTIKLSKIVTKFREQGKSILALVHLYYGGTNPTHIDNGYTNEEAMESLFKNITYMKGITGDTICYENGASKEDGMCLRNPKVQAYIKENNIPICLDISHLYIATDGNNDILEEVMIKLYDNIVHYHIVDSLGQVHDSLSLGEGTIDWKRIKPYFNEDALNIFEIGLKDQTDCKEMIDSFEYLINI